MSRRVPDHRLVMVPRTRIQQFARSRVDTSKAMVRASSSGDPNVILPSAWTSSRMAPARTRGRMSSENVVSTRARPPVRMGLYYQIVATASITANAALAKAHWARMRECQASMSGKCASVPGLGQTWPWRPLSLSHPNHATAQLSCIGSLRPLYVLRIK
jgi:hypothetical protein